MGGWKNGHGAQNQYSRKERCSHEIFKSFITFHFLTSQIMYLKVLESNFLFLIIKDKSFAIWAI